ncbi:MAG: hypothetical protein U9N83_06865 [Thermodesulfobacteriota bacterium]|nr:hypothetical protein [Thermodesulfobacteriota bacterium]
MNLIKEKIDVTKKQIGIVIIGLACFFVIFSGTAFSDVLVRDYNISNPSYVKSHPRSVDGYYEDNGNDGLNDDSYRGDNGRTPRSKWEKWGTVW